jgi:tRNA A37 threonylcarbamoyladenosine synthetase subunit TsaC/SUA5/YrdC
MSFAAGIARADGAVGVRCSSHPRAAALVQAAHAAGLGPLTATSLNRHGEPPARSASQARALCAADAADAPLLLETLGEDARDEAPTSVLDLASDPPALLRRGALSAEAIEAAAGIALRPAGEPAPTPSDAAPSGARTTPGEENE